MENNKIKNNKNLQEWKWTTTHFFFIHFFLCFHIFFFLNLLLFTLPFFLSFLLLCFFLFFFSFLLLCFFFSFFFLFSTSHKKMKWQKQRNFHKIKYKSPTLVWNPLPKQFQGPFFSLMFRTTWFCTFWFVMSYKMKEGVKGSKRVTMDINAR